MGYVDNVFPAENQERINAKLIQKIAWPEIISFQTIATSLLIIVYLKLIICMTIIEF
jgi:hypothetical protein